MIKLSPYHEIYFNEWKLNPNRSDYNVVIDNEIHGEINQHRLDRALRRLSDDFFLLHSCVKEVEGDLYWVPDSDARLRFNYYAHRLAADELITYVKSPFDLNKEVPFRVALIRLGPQKFRLILVVHHILMDNTKEGFICNVLPLYYNDKNYHTTSLLETQRAKLGDFSEKYIRWLDETGPAHQQFWTDQLKTLPGVNLNFLATSKHSSNEKDIAIGETTFNFNSSILNQIRLVAKKHTTTPYLLLLSIFGMALFRHTQQQSFGICIPIAIHGGADFIYGSNVSPTVFSFKHEYKEAVQEVINSTKCHFKSIQTAGRYHYPLQKIPTSIVNKDLFDVAFTQTNLKDIRFNFEGTISEIANSDLNVDLAGKLLFAQEIKNGQLNFRVMFKRECIDADLLSNFINTFHQLTKYVVGNLLDCDALLPLHRFGISNDEKEILINRWNDTGRPFPQKTLHVLFEEQVAKTPDQIALIYKKIGWSYAELNNQANRVAHYLRKIYSIGPDDVVGICMQPSHHMITALWAILKAGCAYLPIDPSHPAERLRFLLNDTLAKVIVTDEYSADRFRSVFEHDKKKVINLEDENLSVVIQHEPTTNPVTNTEPTNLAYVIYTSGTLGTPKGVQIEHHSVVNYVTDLISYNRLSCSSVGAKYAAFSFDCSVIEIYPILLSGGKLCVIEEDVRVDCKRVNEFFHLHGVTYAFLPTPFAELFYELNNQSLSTLMVGGSKLNKYHKTQYDIVNVYGPTETTVQATIFTVNREYKNIPIGKPMSNVKCYVVDPQNELVPIGSIGELWIGGEGVARGYLNLLDLTAQKFIPNPFQSDNDKVNNQNSRIYKTGDLVRWLPDGNLEYIGRNDSQIKIRGHRVELGEIEHRILQHPLIQQATVISSATDSKLPEIQLVVYLVTKQPVTDADLQEYLSQYLPDYMVPKIFVFLAAMPLTTSGKIDKASLPSHALPNKRFYVAPSNILEEIVCSAFAKVLDINIHEVGIHDDFFELGGNSLSAIRLSYILEHRLKLNVAEIFKLKTPAKIARGALANGSACIQQLEQIRLLYQNKLAFASNDWASMADAAIIQKHQRYLQGLPNAFKDVKTQKKMRSLILTGATGFLGCHLLRQLLNETSYEIYLLVRADSDQTAFERVRRQYKYYFSDDLIQNSNRIKAFNTKLDDKYLGMAFEDYEKLIKQVDSIIHCAALVKYEGSEDEYRRSNIQPTINLLEFSRQTISKDFHYISTIGVILDGHVVDKKFVLFNEDDALHDFVRGKHPYIQSKFEAEQHVLTYREKGVRCTIYRVGNLVMNSQTYNVQENIQENMFFAHLKSLMQFKTIPKEVSHIEASPVDWTASAIVKMFDKDLLSNQVHHVFNPTTCDLRKIFEHFEEYRKLKCTLEEFVKEVVQKIEIGTNENEISNLLMLYQLWLRETDGVHSTCIRISAQKTEFVLGKLGFEWPKLTPKMFERFINASRPTELKEA